MVGIFIAQVSIAAFIIGSILGTPIVGVAALTAIGLGVIAVDIALQAATIAKAVSNFDDADEDEKRLEADYGRVADSSIAIVIMLVLVALGAVTKSTAAALLRRFPALGRIAEGLKAKVKGGLGIKPKRPPKITSKLKPLDPVPPPPSIPERAKRSATRRATCIRQVDVGAATRIRPHQGARRQGRRGAAADVLEPTRLARRATGAGSLQRTVGGRDARPEDQEHR